MIYQLISLKLSANLQSTTYRDLLSYLINQGWIHIITEDNIIHGLILSEESTDEIEYALKLHTNQTDKFDRVAQYPGIMSDSPLPNKSGLVDWFRKRAYMTDDLT